MRDNLHHSLKFSEKFCFLQLASLQSITSIMSATISEMSAPRTKLAMFIDIPGDDSDIVLIEVGDCLRQNGSLCGIT